MRKLSASALNTYLRSPKKFFWTYVAELVPIQKSVATFDHDMLLGIIWSNFIDRFYKEFGEKENVKLALDDWDEKTYGWVPDKAHARLKDALTSWSASYYQMFSPTDGCRTPEQSELFVENDRFVGYLDGLSEERIVHEVKSTSRSPSLVGQLWKVTNSTQVKLYAVMTEAEGVCIEFAFKDKPYKIFRGPVTEVSKEQRKGWEQELNALADHIYSLGDDPHNYPCHPDGCCLVTRGITSMCAYEILCSDGVTDVTQHGFKPKERRK